MSKWKKKLYNPVYVKETKLRVRNIKFALTILFYNLILIGIAVFGFEVLFKLWNGDRFICCTGRARICYGGISCTIFYGWKHCRRA